MIPSRGVGMPSGAKPPFGCGHAPGEIGRRVQNALDRDGRPQPGQPNVVLAGESEEEGDHADPAAHWASIGVTWAGKRRGLAVSHRRGNDVLPRGLWCLKRETSI